MICQQRLIAATDSSLSVGLYRIIWQFIYLVHFLLTNMPSFFPTAMMWWWPNADPKAADASLDKWSHFDGGGTLRVVYRILYQCILDNSRWPNCWSTSPTMPCLFFSLSFPFHHKPGAAMPRATANSILLSKPQWLLAHSLWNLLWKLMKFSTLEWSIKTYTAFITNWNFCSANKTIF